MVTSSLFLKAVAGTRAEESIIVKPIAIRTIAAIRRLVALIKFMQKISG